MQCKCWQYSHGRSYVFKAITLMSRNECDLLLLDCCTFNTWLQIGGGDVSSLGIHKPKMPPKLQKHIINLFILGHFAKQCFKVFYKMNKSVSNQTKKYLIGCKSTDVVMRTRSRLCLRNAQQGLHLFLRKSPS